MKAHVVHIGHGANLGREIEIGAGIHEKNSRIHEVGLAFFFVGAQIRQKAIRRNQGDAGSGETDAFTIEEAENTTSKRLRFTDGIKAARCAVSRIAISGSEER